jgi:hypothetical protein
MEADQFDSIARARSAGLPRRGMIAGILSGVIPALSGMRAIDGEAKGRKKKRKRDNKRDQCTPQITCGARTVQCGNQCLGPCPAGQPLDPIACTCCVANGTGCSDQTGPCCSGICAPGGAGNACVGRDDGATCQFGAQCKSGTCNGVCTP